MRTTLALIGTLVLASACVTPGKRTAIGGGAGAATGAAIGGVAAGWKGAAVGAIAGGAAGAAVGNYLDRQAQELAKVADTRRTRDGILVTLKNELLFAVDSAQLAPAAQDDVAKLADILVKYPDDRIVVEGHTDSSGPNAYNESLSFRRAETIRAVLKARGVQDGQVLVQGRGEAEPVADNASADGRAKNRRVELHIDVPNKA
jgi:outer membrane protein OmpA-like peptidoglycan-associated protein